MSKNFGAKCLPGSSYCKGDLERALSDIQFNMADVALSAYAMKRNQVSVPRIGWRPRKPFLERMFAFYGNPLRRRLLMLEKELMFKGQLVMTKPSLKHNPLRCLVESPPDSDGNVRLVAIDFFGKQIHRPDSIYFLASEFATCLPPWLTKISEASPITWPDRYCLPSAYPNRSEWEIATEPFRRFRQSPSLEDSGTLAVMVRIMKVLEPDLYLAKPVQWLRQAATFRKVLRCFYDCYKEELRLNAQLLRVGLPVAFVVYGEWHRGEVLTLPGSLGLMEVLYLDEGTTEQVCCKQVFHLAKQFTELDIGLLRIRVAGILAPTHGWPDEAYEYAADDCLDKELFFLSTHQEGDVYEGYLSHGENAKTSLRSLGTQWVGDNLARNFGALSLASKPFEVDDET